MIERRRVITSPRRTPVSRVALTVFVGRILAYKRHTRRTTCNRDGELAPGRQEMASDYTQRHNDGVRALSA